MAKLKKMKIQRGERRFRPLWLLAVTAAAAAASFAAAGLWQEMQLSVAAAEAASSPAESSSAMEALASAPIEKAPVPVPMHRDAQEASRAEAKPPDFSVEYQAPASPAVEDSYFSDAMFVGDSITTGISLYQAMADATVIAATGINPSTILTKPVIRDREGALHTVLESMAGYQPKKIYVQLGANGVAWINQESFIARYRELIAKIQAQHPDAQIYIQSIFPVTMEKSVGENGMYANEKINAYNNALMEMCRDAGLPYLNVAEVLRGPDGALPADASVDGIHFGPAYYQKWFDYLKTHTVSPPAADGGVTVERTEEGQ